MKKIVLILSLFVGIQCLSQDSVTDFTNLSNERSIMFTESSNIKIDNNQFKLSYYNNEPKIGLGLGLFLGGAVLTTAGLLTQPPTMENSNKDIVNKPFLQQGPRAISIISGGLCMGIGCVISLSKL
jgi:hypothetical protein